jgi:WD40 repeat protein
MGDTKETARGAPRGFNLLWTLKGHNDYVCRVAWTRDGCLLVSGSADGTVRIWDAKTGHEVNSLRRHSGKVISLALAPRDQYLVSGTETGAVKCWDLTRQEEYFTSTKHQDSVLDLSVSLDGSTFVSASADHTLKTFSFENREDLHTFRGHDGAVNAVVVTPNGDDMISASDDETIKSWSLHKKKINRVFEGHTGAVLDLVLSPEGRDLFSASSDASIKVWDVSSGRLIRTLEGHTGRVTSLAISSDGEFLASRALDNTVRLWNCKDWSAAAILDEEINKRKESRALAFHPSNLTLASLTDNGKAIRIWQIDKGELDLSAIARKHKGQRRSTAQAQYANAKIVLVGDSGVGKSGLSLVLLGQEFEPTDSTHGRKVKLLSQERVIDQRSGLEETRELLLWDLAGQPGYRVFHRQHLDEVAVALVLFDSKSETDPFSGVAFWGRCLDEATRGFPLVKFLVASRVDRTGPSVSQARIDDMCRKYGFVRYFETSARRGDGIDELRTAIYRAVPWDNLPRVNTPELFADMKDFIVREKELGRVVQRRSDLLGVYQSQGFKKGWRKEVKAKRTQTSRQEMFAICLNRIEAAGLIKRMSFGDLVVLQPELLDDYTAWIAQAARSEPDGLGYVSERTARNRDFKMDNDRPLKGRDDEVVLIAATIEDVVGRGIALRQGTEDGEMLVFPSELREDIPDYPGDYVRAVAFNFEGPLKAIHSTLAVRLAHAVAFSRPNARPRFYKNAALFKSASGEVCGFSTDYLDSDNHNVGRITAFFEAETSKNTKLTFLRYLNRHIADMAYEDSIRRERVFVCNCGYLFPVTAVDWCKANGRNAVVCPLGHSAHLDDLAEQIEDWDEVVDKLRLESTESIERDERLTVLKDREHWNEHDIFLCHDSNDKAAIRQLASGLRQHGVIPWIDEDEILAGDHFIGKLEEIIERIPVVGVVFGAGWPSRIQQAEYESFLGQDKRVRDSSYRWQQLEYYAFLHEYMNPSRHSYLKRLRMIPILIPGASDSPALPVFLRGLNWVDFRSTNLNDRSQYRRLVRAILDQD